jgi:hypothetical protein
MVATTSPHFGDRLDAQDVKRHVDLLALIGRDTQLTRIAATRGGEYAGACPFCGGDDRFRVHPEPGEWWCRHCSPSEKWEDAIAYVMRRDRLTFPEALAQLAGEPGPTNGTPTSTRPAAGTRPAARTKERPWWVDAEPVARWAYTDPETGEVVAYHERRERPHPQKPGQVEKAYPWTHPDGRLSRTGELKPEELPLYGDALLRGRPGAVAVVLEGEKAVDAFNEAAEREGIAGQVVAVSFPGGASQRRLGRALQDLAGRPVVAVWPDHDPPGAELAAHVAGQLQTGLSPAPGGVVLLQAGLFFPGEPAAGQDAWEWVVRDGMTAAAVLDLIHERRAPAAEEEAPHEPPPAPAPDPPPPPAEDRPPRLKLRTLCEVQAQPVEHLPGGVLIKSAQQLVVGDPGLGKTRLLLEACAGATRGRPWPFGDDRGEPGHVFYVGHEDSPEQVIRPVVVEALGGDPSRFHLIDALEVTTRRGDRKESMFSLSAEGIEALDAAMDEYRPTLMVFDPVSGHLGGADSFKDAEVRERLMPLSRLAQKYGTAIVSNAHMNKAQQAAVAYRVGGSIAFYAVARAVFYVVQDPNDPRRRAFFHKKGNMAELTEARGFSIAGHYVDERIGSVGIPAWDTQPVDFTLEDALRATGEGPEARQKRESVPQMVLRSILLARGGKALATEVYAVAETMGVPKRTLDRAKAALGVVSRQETFHGPYSWYLPAATDPNWKAPGADGGADE